MKPEEIATLAWNGGLLPAIVQDVTSGAVLMLGYMNEDALRRTLEGPHVVFFSRSKDRLWEKGETSGHFLDVVSVQVDCDRDTLLVRARPHGPTCHTGEATCFGAARGGFLDELATVVDQRVAEGAPSSYTAKLWASGPRRIAQKVGEEGVEVALAAVAQEPADVVAESADLLFHLLVLLKSRGLALADVVAELERRHAKSDT